MKPSREYRDWNHWRCLNRLPPAKYARAIRLWRALFHKRPCGFEIDANGSRLRLDDA